MPRTASTRGQTLSRRDFTPPVPAATLQDTSLSCDNHEIEPLRDQARAEGASAPRHKSTVRRTPPAIIAKPQKSTTMTNAVNPPRFSPHQRRGGIRKASGDQEMMGYSRSGGVQETPRHQTTRGITSADLDRRQGTSHVVAGEHTLSGKAEGRRGGH